MLTVFGYEDGTGELRFSTQDAHNFYIHTINYNRATNDYNIGLLHSIISDAKIANLGDTYKGEVDLLWYNNSNMKCTKSQWSWCGSS